MKQEPRLVSEDGGQESEQPPGRTLDEVAAEMPATALVRAVRRESTAAVPFSFFCAGLQGSSLLCFQCGITLLAIRGIYCTGIRDHTTKRVQTIRACQSKEYSRKLESL